MAKPFRMNGERGGNRTCNLLIKSQLLCQLSYAPSDVLFYSTARHALAQVFGLLLS